MGAPCRARWATEKLLKSVGSGGQSISRLKQELDEVWLVPQQSLRKLEPRLFVRIVYLTLFWLQCTEKSRGSVRA